MPRDCLNRADLTASSEPADRRATMQADRIGAGGEPAADPTAGEQVES